MPRQMWSPRHIGAGRSVIGLGIIISGVVSILSVVGGIIAIIWNAVSPTDAQLFGQKITTGHVGVAFVFIGLVVLAVVIRTAYSTIVKLGQIPEDDLATRQARHDEERIDNEP